MKQIFLVLSLLVGQFSMASVYLNKATVVLKEGTQDRYFAAAKQFDILTQTRKEPGNLQYILKTDRLKPRLVIFHEIWKTKADLDAHLQTPHMAGFFKSINFDPALYNITVKGNAVTFTPKAILLNYVIEMLVLEGVEK
tara:strand:+ start:15794 stop:16210 length:417 start_codon:yes stop_codon:yes gene_type:complete